MNNRIKNLYVANKDNITVCCDTNIKGLHKKFKTIEPECYNYQWFYRKFAKTSHFDWKEYHFQKIV